MSLRYFLHDQDRKREVTTIKTTCAACGDLELSSDELTLELAPEMATGRYRFACPFCRVVQDRPANERVVAILLAIGVAYSVGDERVSEGEIKEFVDSLDDWLDEISTA